MSVPGAVLRLAVVCLALLALPAATAAAQSHGLSFADMDTTCAPCQDFYSYANGGWIERTTMPAAYARYGSFDELQDRNLENLRLLLEDAVRQMKRRGSRDLGRLGLFYGSCMDSGRAEIQGWRPVEPVLERIASLESMSELSGEVAHLHAGGVPTLFRFYSAADPGNSTMMIATASQGGLGLPDRGYYLKPDPDSEKLREEYEAHVARSLGLVEIPRAEAGRQARAVMEIETALARASMTRVERRDPRATYHRMLLDEVRGLCPSFDWNAYLIASRITEVTDVNVRQPGFLTALDSLLQATPLEDWKAYLRWHVVRDASPLLSSVFVQEDFRFRQLLTGAKAIAPRWRRCLQATDRLLGEALGREYVKTYFPPEAKKRALAMVENLRAALRDRINGLSWMSQPTKEQALRKLDVMGVKIGYPDKWRSYSRLRLKDQAFYLNQAEASRFERAYRLGKIGKPVDKGEFSMTPPTVNARYSSSLNDILFPAGILQPPFFDPEADDALNYGGIGAVIGHEMTHGFDDRGRQFDAEGNLRDWWTPGDAVKYKEQAERITAQFDAYTVLDSVHVNGRLTTGENLSDLGGLTVAYAALQKALAGRPRTRIDGFTPEQRFFLAWARIWRQHIRPEEARRRIATDSHSPAVWRVNGPLANMPEFEQAFGCTDSDAMMRPQELRVVIW
jgi:predicted metalloendopeptidase